MVKLSEIENYLESEFPRVDAADWDNVGLIFGRFNKEVGTVMTCLTVTPEVVAEARREKVDLVVSHHPFPFKKMNRLTSGFWEGKMVLDLAGADICVYSPHTSFDSAPRGINQMTLEGLGLSDIQPLIPPEDRQIHGSGRFGQFSEGVRFSQFVQKVKAFYGLSHLKCVPTDKMVKRVAVACGAGGDFMTAAKTRKCDVFITGELSFHACISAKIQGLGIVLTGHYGSERFAVEKLANQISQKFSDVAVFSSKAEQNPVSWC